MRLGRNMRHALRFYAQHETAYHSFSQKDPGTKYAIGRLVELGFLELCPNVPDMARITEQGLKKWKELTGS